MRVTRVRRAADRYPDGPGSFFANQIRALDIANRAGEFRETLSSEIVRRRLGESRVRCWDGICNPTACPRSPAGRKAHARQAQTQAAPPRRRADPYPTASIAARGRRPIRSMWPMHDEEWGVPNGTNRALFEKLILDGFQAGLSWITILRKRGSVPRRPSTASGRGHRRLGRGQDRKPWMAKSGHRPQPRQDPWRRSRSPGSISICSTRRLRQAYLEFRRGPADPERRAASIREISRRDRARRDDRQGPARARRQFRRPDDRTTRSCRRSAWSTIISSTATGHAACAALAASRPW